MNRELLALEEIKNVILDLDGTLIDSNDAHAHAYVDSLEKNGIKTINFNNIRKLIGMNSHDILNYILEQSTFETKASKIDIDRLRIFKERYMEQIQPIQGFLPLMELMKTYGIKIAISSASPREIVDYFVKKLNIESIIEGSTSSDDVSIGKPNPMAIEVCCQKFGFLPVETLMIGDSPYDIIAAHEFSIPVIAVLTGGYSREELLKTGATTVYEDLHEIYDKFQQSILQKG